MDAKSDRISEIFNGEKIFLTGGTGFMGKVFIERLLRLTNVDKIYLLVREKRNKKPSERVEEIFQNPVSDFYCKFNKFYEKLKKPAGCEN